MSTTFEECKVKAEKGDADSQYNLGSMYEFGRSASINHKEAIRWYKKAALQGDAVAQFKLGSLNSHDYKESLKWHQLSADQGHSDAQYELGLMYKLGKGVVKDNNKADIWFKSAADQNHSGALRELRNFDVEPDRFYDDERSKWYELAAEQGNTKAQYKLYTLSHRLGISDNDALTWLHASAKKEYLEAQRALGSIYAEDDTQFGEFGDEYATREEKLKWIRVAAECGELVAQRYLYGKSGEKQPEDAYKWTLLDAKQGNTDSQYELGLMYLYGRGTKQSYKEAAKWWLNYFKDGGDTDIDEFADYEDKVLLKLLQAAVNICTEDNLKYLAHIQHLLGRMYLWTTENNDKGLELINQSVENGCYDAYEWIGNWYDDNNNMDEAIKWYKAGAEHGDSHWQLVMGGIYLEGSDVKKDYKESFKWYLLAAKQKNQEAQLKIGEMYASGQGTLKDPKKAIEWYGKAIENGNLNAQFNLAHIFYKELNNSKKAIEWWTKAAENGNIAAMFNIGVVNSNRGTFKEAAKWYGKAADKGYAEAQYALGVIHHQEDSVKDYVKSKYWINKAFESPDTDISKKAENFWNKHELWNY
jgi:TPR repeat protein